MFKELTNFSYKRNLFEAIGFYIAYSLLSLILAEIAVAIFMNLNYIFGDFFKISQQANFIDSVKNGFQLGIIIGHFFYTIYCLILSLEIICKKHLGKNFIAITLSLLSLLFVYFGGALLGLIPITILSSMDTVLKNNNYENSEKFENEYCPKCGIPLLYPDKPCPNCNKDHRNNKTMNTEGKTIIFAIIAGIVCSLFVLYFICNQTIKPENVNLNKFIPKGFIINDKKYANLTNAKYKDIVISCIQKDIKTNRYGGFINNPNQYITIISFNREDNKWQKIYDVKSTYEMGGESTLKIIPEILNGKDALIISHSVGSGGFLTYSILGSKNNKIEAFGGRDFIYQGSLEGNKNKIIEKSCGVITYTFEYNDKNLICKKYNYNVPVEIYSYNGFYAYYLPKDQFNLKKIIKFSQTKQYNDAGFVEVFYYDRPINTMKMQDSDKTIPGYLIDEGYNNEPYFVFNGLRNNQEWYCRINGTRQKYYHKNIVQGENYFHYVTSFDYGFLDGMSGCNPYYR